MRHYSEAVKSAVFEAQRRVLFRRIDVITAIVWAGCSCQRGFQAADLVVVAIKAGGLVIVARELLRLQLVRVLMASGACSCRWARAWFRRSALAASRASTDFLGRLGSVTLSSQARYAYLYGMYGLQDRRSRRHLAASTWQRPAVRVYYWLSGEGSAWVGFGYSTSRAGSP